MAEELIPKETIPIIDFSVWTSPTASPSDRLSMAQQLVSTCHKTGFVYIKNHDISPELLEEAFAWTKNFFYLPKDKKMQAGHPDGSISFRGYSWPGLETIPDTTEDPKKTTRDVQDHNESYVIGSDENTEDVNVWLPDPILPGFRKFTTMFYWECWKAGQNILRAISLGLGLEDEEALLKYHSGHGNELSLRHYPPVKESIISADEMRLLGVHTDFDSITLLFQDDCDGLEVQKSEAPGKFIHAEPIQDALLMNIGDVLMRWSNDYLKSTMHRVRLPLRQDRYIGVGTERRTKSRYSIPYFVSPDAGTMLKCLPTCQSEKNPPKYDSIQYGELRCIKASQIFEAQVGSQLSTQISGFRPNKGALSSIKWYFCP